MTPEPEQRVTITPGVCEGLPCIAGTRIRVWDIAVLTNAGKSPDEIRLQFPSLSLEEVNAALSYYHDHREMIDAQGISAWPFPLYPELSVIMNDDPTKPLDDDDWPEEYR